MELSESVATQSDAGSVYINRDRLFALPTSSKSSSFSHHLPPLFNIDYSVERHYNKRGQQSRLAFEQYTHTDLIQSSLVPVEPTSNISKNLDTYKLELSIRDEFFTTAAASSLSAKNDSSINSKPFKLMLGKYTIRVAVLDRLTPTCTPRVDVFYLYVGNNFIDEKELIGLLRSIKYRNYSDVATETATTFESVNSIKRLHQNHDDGYYDTKHDNKYLFFGRSQFNLQAAKETAHKLLNSDFFLLFVLILVIVATALLLTFVCIFCIYGRYKKQYKMSKKTAKSSCNSDGKINKKVFCFLSSKLLEFYLIFVRNEKRKEKEVGELLGDR